MTSHWNIDNKISVLVIGEMNVGKSTFINSIYSDVLADAKPIRTTSGISIYDESLSNTDSSKIIYQKNNLIDTTHIDTKESKTNSLSSLTETYHTIKPSTDIGSELINKGYSLRIIDTPGFNDSDSKFEPLVYSWIENNFKHIDVILFMQNYHTGGGITATNEKMVRHILNQSKNYPDVVMLSLINKCDDLDNMDNNYNNIVQNVVQKLDSIYSEYGLKYDPSSILTLSAQKGYLYRYIMQNKTLDGLSDFEKRIIIKHELGHRAINEQPQIQLKRLLEIIKKGDSYYNAYYGQFVDQFNKYVIKSVEKIYTRRIYLNIIDLEISNLENILIQYQKLMKINYASHKYYYDILTQYFGNVISHNITNIKSINDVCHFIATYNKYKDVINTFYRNITNLKKDIVNLSSKYLNDKINDTLHNNSDISSFLEIASSSDLITHNDLSVMFVDYINKYSTNQNAYIQKNKYINQLFTIFNNKQINLDQNAKYQIIDNYMNNLFEMIVNNKKFSDINENEINMLVNEIEYELKSIKLILPKTYGWKYYRSNNVFIPTKSNIDFSKSIIEQKIPFFMKLYLSVTQPDKQIEYLPEDMKTEINVFALTNTNKSVTEQKQEQDDEPIEIPNTANEIKNNDSESESDQNIIINNNSELEPTQTSNYMVVNSKRRNRNRKNKNNRNNRH